MEHESLSLSAVVGLIFIGMIILFSCNDECAKKICRSGNTPMLINHRCICVERPQ